MTTYPPPHFHATTLFPSAWHPPCATDFQSVAVPTPLMSVLEEGKLSVIHQDTADKYHLVENVPTQFGVRTMDMDPTTQRIFSATADLTPDPGKRPPYKMTPGSFRLVVFGK